MMVTSRSCGPSLNVETRLTQARGTRAIAICGARGSVGLLPGRAGGLERGRFDSLPLFAADALSRFYPLLGWTHRVASPDLMLSSSV